MAKVLLTVFTVRSEEKGQKVMRSFPNPPETLSFAVVEDIVLKGASPLDFIIHTASPYHFNVTDPVKDFHEPALLGTKNLLEAVEAHAPSVRRIVLTSSFAAIVNPQNHARVYDETVLATFTEEEAMSPRGAYRASKILAEKAAFRFVEERQPRFDVVTINPPMVYGPVPSFLTNLDDLNTSNKRIRDMIQGQTHETGLAPTVVYIFADVRDVALAHVRALQVPEAGGQRFLITGGYYSNSKIADVIRAEYPQLAEKLPPPKAVVNDTPADVYGFDNGRSRRVLGLRYRSFEECIRDAVASMLTIP
ncbi:hypothetical protein S7711_07900 [Stachybotrys chartarum IBT 7711]|uniref:NAD-dependent epimerase/dehydratase domain-containing protein n=1 Tax=Stachybotrys chartarum (strain CBS 109288 / IBT 7711) TaxID=1280523 RepID=A0A084B5V7_STACB|nr:hypothetical protein S7711_07900 [Stachybotrys chartarum IBT 7711]KFA47963.1 hypothetical protein S40293_09077 [Stachybotrys chartarum IBT 40293]